MRKKIDSKRLNLTILQLEFLRTHYYYNKRKYAQNIETVVIVYIITLDIKLNLPSKSSTLTKK